MYIFQDQQLLNYIIGLFNHDTNDPFKSHLMGRVVDITPGWKDKKAHPLYHIAHTTSICYDENDEIWPNQLK